MSMDLTSLALAAAGAYALTQLAGDNNEAFGHHAGTTTQGGASTTVLDQLSAAGVTVSPTDQVQQITHTTPAGQTITYATVNYNPWAPQSNQTVWLNPYDPQRSQGWYIPQIEPAMVALLGGETAAIDLFKRAATRTDIMLSGPQQAAYQYKMPIKDWDALRTWSNSAQQPITEAEAVAQGLTLNSKLTMNEYWDAIQRAGGWIAGVEVKKGNRSQLSGLSGLGNLPGFAFRLARQGFDLRWY